MEILNCLVIEDQVPAQNTIIGFIDQAPHLNLLETYISPLEAIEVIESGIVDVLFLDIHLPKLSGIQLIKSLKNKPQTIITTAFSEYALEGYDLDIVDYLLKPFSLERFLKATSKIRKEASATKATHYNSAIFIKSQGQIKKVVLEDIRYIQAKGDFLLIHLEDSREIANLSLQKMQELLALNFLRSHKSYIVNVKFIDKIVGNQIIIGNDKIPIGRTFKDKLMNDINLV